ncbi:MAG: hypothetical protein JST30_15505 [Armatimonadetes bacterium]|nr:hypothetical protein [Armatimonadota bacterium]
MAERSFAEDVGLLQKQPGFALLKEGSSAVAVVGGFQARVMTSTVDAENGEGLGWINHSLIESGKTGPHINVYGGEDRFWLGPEGGQFSIFFKSGDPYDLEHWQTPAPIDTMAYDLKSTTDEEARFEAGFSVTNASGTRFDLRVDRKVQILSADQARLDLGLPSLEGVRCVSFRTINVLKNVGEQEWTHGGGALSVWILGMFKPGDRTTVLMPYEKMGSGPVVNDSYFGKVPDDRLKTADRVVYFKADGKHRSKIGVAPKRVRQFRAGSAMGSYDPDRSLLTVVTYTYNPGFKEYVNSMWEHQDEPFAGDVANSYNDGPPTPGAAPLGPFYELESSSPALFLKPGGSYTHMHATYHFVGPATALDPVCRHCFGVGLGDVEKAFDRSR